MFRCSVLLCFSVVLYNTTARPYKSQDKELDTAAQDTRYHESNEKIMMGFKEMEPVEEQDLKVVDTNPLLEIRKALKQYHQQKHNIPEEGTDKLYIPADVVQLAGNEQVEAYKEPQGQLYQEAEEDLDDVYHNIEGLEDYADIFVPDEGEEVELHEISVYTTPEEDKDGLYHEDLHTSDPDQEFQVAVMEDHPDMVYTEPEEDQDPLFHR